MAPRLPWRFLQFLLLLLGVSSAAQAQVNITRGSALTPEGPNSSWLSPSGDFAFGFQPMEEQEKLRRQLAGPRRRGGQAGERSPHMRRLPAPFVQDSSVTQGRLVMSPSLLLKFLCGLLFVAGEVALIAAESGGGDDKEVLVELKRFLVANNKVNRGGYETWQESDPSPCLWRGVGCNGDGRVASLNLTSSTISGPMFGNFSRLSALTSLDLSDNSIVSALPASDLNQCHGLVHLNISHNLITGSLNVSGLTKLRVLDMSANRLEGGVAINFPAICANLTLLHLSTNNMTGNITNMLEGCARLEYVDLSSNNFDGELLADIARFRKFSVAENNLTGSVPWSTFPDGCKLQSLDLSANQLVGNFPNSMAKCTNLTYLSLWGNNFAGMVPAGIGNLASLEALVLGNNGFDRQIPQELTNCVSLQFLDISRNMFGGNVQEIFGNFMSSPPLPSPRRSRGRPREETLAPPSPSPSPQPPPSPSPGASPAKGRVALAAAGRLSPARSWGLRGAFPICLMVPGVGPALPRLLLPLPVSLAGAASSPPWW